MNKDSLIPEMGATYNCFDDGKIRESRRYTVEVFDVVPFENCDQETLGLWRAEARECHWLYAPETDFFIHCFKGNDVVVFVRTLEGNWFSIGNMFECGVLDIDGSLVEILRGQNE